MQLDFFYHNRTPSYASMSTISGHAVYTHMFAEKRVFSIPCSIHKTFSTVI